MTAFLDELARSMAKPLPRRRALRLIGGAVVAAAVPGIATTKRARAASRFHTCERDGGRLCECNCKGEICQRICCEPRALYECDCGPVEVGAGCRCIRPCGSNLDCCKPGEYCASVKDRLCCKEGQPGCGSACCKKNEECTDDASERCERRCPKTQEWCGKKKCCPKGTVCCNKESGVCCKTRAACCGSPRRTATSFGTFCCSGKGIQGPVCVNKARDICCRSGEVPCIERYEAAKYPCCPKGSTCCGKNCCPKGTVCCSEKSGVCCKTKAACCGSPRPTATSRGTFCCSGTGIQGPVCVDKPNDICCRSGEVPCIGAYEFAKYPCCASGTTCCRDGCWDTQRDPKNCGSCGNVCESGVCGGGICALP
jgi:hypothetical protein